MNPAADTQTPANRLLRAFVFTAVMLLVHLVAAMVFVLFMTQVVPGFVDMFAACEADLSNVTVIVVEVSRVTIKFWYLMILAVIVLDGAFLFSLQFLPPGLAFIKRLWFSLFPLAMLGSLALAMMVLGSALGSM